MVASRFAGRRLMFQRRKRNPVAEAAVGHEDHTDHLAKTVHVEPEPNRPRWSAGSSEMLISTRPAAL